MTEERLKIGVLALQGSFREHLLLIGKCGQDPVEIKKPEQLDQVSGLIIPGGECSTLSRLLQDYNLKEKVLARAGEGMPIFGTSAGMILLAKEVEGNDLPTLGLMDITVRRNAFGRQRESFETDLSVPVLGEEPVRAVFIRAPYVVKIKPNVGILATLEDKIVMVRQGNYLAAAFHPELTEDLCIHQYFLQMVRDSI